jgi:hypothetical protein
VSSRHGTKRCRAAFEILSPLLCWVIDQLSYDPYFLHMCAHPPHIYGDHFAWPLVVGALLDIAKRGAQPQTLLKLSGANCAGPMGNP